MSCEYCRHRSIAYTHHKDDKGRDVYTKVAETIPYDEEPNVDAEPMISWWMEPETIDWAEHRPRLCVGAYDSDGEEVCISIPINYCPMCGEKLPSVSEVDA